MDTGAPPARRGRGALAIGALGLALVLLAYANHFANGFHFDDAHSIVDNVFIRDLHNVPRFFTDATTFSTLPQNQGYRPLLLLTYALDYRLAGGLKPWAFQLTSFVLFLGQCLLMAFLFTRLLELASPADRNRTLAVFAAALYGVHTAIAETVNYVSARSDILSTALLVAALTTFVALPRARRWGIYLLPFLLAGLAKPVVVVFPLLVFAYVALFEDEGGPRRAMLRAAVASIPSVGTAAAVAALQWRMTPPGFNPGGSPRFNYLVTQPYVALRYFGKFLFPAGLSADTDLAPLTSAADPRALAGFAFLLVVIAATVWATRRRATRPIAFGLVWFLVALLPTSLFPLAEVENDHRMYFPFVGLALAAVAAANRAVERWAGSGRRVPRWAAGAGVLVLVALAWGTHERNRVWRDEESLWRDTTRTSPGNGRAWLNYGLTQMARGRLDDALACFARAKTLAPGYSYVYVNTGIALAAEGRHAEAEAEFLEGVRLGQRTAEPSYYYARFLAGQGRDREALVYVRRALEESPAHPGARHLLLELLARTGDSAALARAARETLALWPADEAAKRALAGSARAPAPERPSAPERPNTPEALLAESLALYRIGRYEESIAACRNALKLRPDYADAYNNICAASNQLGEYDRAIAACEQALRLRPDFDLARNNLRWAQARAAAARR